MPTAYEPFDWYADPLYYDLIFDVGTEEESGFLDAAVRRYGRSRAPTSRRTLVGYEPACGSGRLLAAMAARGYRVLGSDLSEGMLDYARRKLERAKLKAGLLQGDMSTVQPPELVDFAWCLVSTFKYLLTHEQAIKHLTTIGRALRPGGIYILGLHLSDYDRLLKTHERWTASSEGIDVVCNIQGWPPDPKTRLEHVRTRLRVNDHGRKRNLQTEWDFRTYDLGQLYELLDQAPWFEIAANYNFLYRIDEPIPLDGSYEDNLLILRKIAEP
ncbi:MAG: class I SAM-dependent methyltransferase [Phycisphaeraceae bacterium]|nr:class I SAM-dependent methyltransferase [Phycisphaeraceae bacterium]